MTAGASTSTASADRSSPVERFGAPPPPRGRRDGSGPGGGARRAPVTSGRDAACSTETPSLTRAASPAAAPPPPAGRTRSAGVGLVRGFVDRDPSEVAPLVHRPAPAALAATARIHLQRFRGDHPMAVRLGAPAVRWRPSIGHPVILPLPAPGSAPIERTAPARHRHLDPGHHGQLPRRSGVRQPRELLPDNATERSTTS